MSVNKVILVGHLGKDPEVKYMANETAVCNFSIATNRSYKDKAGERVEQTEWHNITFFGKQAEVIKEYLKKGNQIYIEGPIQTTQSEKDGQTRYFTNIIGEQFSFIGGKNDSSNTSSSSNEEFNQEPSKLSESEDDSNVKQNESSIDDGDYPF
jgi:single-strand DNA-binding protein